MEIVLVGLNFRTAPVEVREKASFSQEQAQQASEELRSSGILEESLVLSTCNRSEVYGVNANGTRESAAALSSYLSKFHKLKPDLLSASLYHHYDHDVVRHLFRVSAGLDSMLLGEAEILGQVREAYLRAHDSHVTGPVLNRLFQAALEIGKRVRAETELGTRPMGVASAGMKLAERIFGKLKERTALVLGAGTISEQVVSQLRDRNIGHLYVTNRSREKAEEFAKLYQGKVIEWGEWDTALKLPDVIVSAVGVQEPLLTKAMIEKAMAARGNRALFLMDLGLPRNVAPAVADLYNTYLYTMDDLTEIVQQNKDARQSEVPKAEALVEEHVAKFISWQASVELIGVLDTLRAQLKARRAAFLQEKLNGTEKFGVGEREQLEKLMDELIEKLLIAPAERLRAEKEFRRKIQSVEAIRELYLSDLEKP
ncbi:MAG TPA: glutamyl-tRNA reductase [Candidatus Eremiobacteraceae bacterium]|nr:glutamyl-tRNA reductase [Candidatus Eremiobacteraceae bacterium]